MIKHLLLAVSVSSVVTPIKDTAELRRKMDEAICRRAVEYHAPPGVTYEPGVDVSGKPVVEADINKSPVIAPERVEAVITVDLGHYLGLLDAAAGDSTQGDAVIGDLIYDNGSFTFNGKPLNGESAAALRALCATPPPPPKNNHNDH